MVTDKSIKELENSQVALTVTVDAATVQGDYVKKLQKYTKEVVIDGFRKGKVPQSVLERKYGKVIWEESLFETLETALKEAEKDLEPKYQPLPFELPELQDEETVAASEKGKDVTFTVKYDVKPSFELPQYKGLEIEVPEVEVTEADVNKEIEKYRDSNSIVRIKDGEVENGDIVTVDYYEVKDGEPVESTKRDGFTFTVGSGYNYYKIDEDILGMRKGDEKTIEKSYTEEDNMPDYTGKTIQLFIAMKEVKHKELPEVDDDLAQDIKEEWKTAEDMINGIKADLQAEADGHKANEEADAIVAKLLGSVDFALPASMVNAQLEQQWKNFLSQSGLGEENIKKFMDMQGTTKEQVLENWKPETVKQLKTQLILDAIKDAENFEVDQAEFEKRAETELKNVPDTERAFYEDALKDDMRYAMVLPFLRANNNFTKGETKGLSDYLGE